MNVQRWLIKVDQTLLHILWMTEVKSCALRGGPLDILGGGVGGTEIPLKMQIQIM
jgi:hypothetical protein